MKPGPNAPCPCGSGRKYKKCHGAPAARPAATPPQGVAESLARGRAFEASGRLPDAERCYQQALERDPRSADAWLALGGLALRAGDAEAARECYGRMVALHPNHAHGHFALGNVHALSHAFDAARAEYARTLELAPKHAGAWGNLGNVLKYCGRLAEALDCYRHAIECEPTVDAQAKRASNRLLALHYDESLAHDDLYAAHREWAERYARPWYPERRAWPNALDPARRLRLGYVSGSLGEQAIVRHFLQGVLDARDRSQFDVTLYSSTPGPPSATATLRAAADRWVEIGALSDADAALRIRADAIDILVDLDGHGPSGRLLIFARKPAPVQVEWLDWFDTSGLDTIDYVLTDPYTTPEGSPQRFSETPVRLPASRLCYTPAVDAPPVAPTPGGNGAPFTFGSFNRQDKLTPQVLVAWARILRALPDARLLLKNRAFAASAVRQSVEGRFAELGIARERLALRGPSPHAQMLAEYGDVDIALDPFPYNGGLTTCECLWMGVPIVALEGGRMISRQSAAMLRLLGLDDWVATSVDEYVRIAVAKPTNAAVAGALRAELRGRFAQSAVCDAARFARDLEAAFRAMWQRYCTGAGRAL